MLVLSRHKDEVVRIGEDITVTVVEIRGDKVRLAFDAPRDILIYRSEVYDAIEREKTRSSAGAEEADST